MGGNGQVVVMELAGNEGPRRQAGLTLQRSILYAIWEGHDTEDIARVHGVSEELVEGYRSGDNQTVMLEFETAVQSSALSLITRALYGRLQRELQDNPLLERRTIAELAIMSDILNRGRKSNIDAIQALRRQPKDRMGRAADDPLCVFVKVHFPYLFPHGIPDRESVYRAAQDDDELRSYLIEQGLTLKELQANEDRKPDPDFD